MIFDKDSFEFINKNDTDFNTHMLKIGVKHHDQYNEFVTQILDDQGKLNEIKKILDQHNEKPYRLGLYRVIENIQEIINDKSTTLEEE